VTVVGKNSQLLARLCHLITKSERNIAHVLVKGIEAIEAVTRLLLSRSSIAVTIVVSGTMIAAFEIVTIVLAGNKNIDGTRRKVTMGERIEVVAEIVIVEEQTTDGTRRKVTISIRIGVAAEIVILGELTIDRTRRKVTIGLRIETEAAAGTVITVAKTDVDLAIVILSFC